MNVEFYPFSQLVSFGCEAKRNSNVCVASVYFLFYILIWRWLFMFVYSCGYCCVAVNSFFFLVCCVWKRAFYVICDLLYIFPGSICRIFIAYIYFILHEITPRSGELSSVQLVNDSLYSAVDETKSASLLRLHFLSHKNKPNTIFILFLKI